MARPGPNRPAARVPCSRGEDAALEIPAYRVLEELGRGGNGRVYLAVDSEGRRVAIKVLTVLSPQGARRFLREARLGHRIHHPGLVRVFAVGETPGGPYLCMEYVEGETLEALEEREAPLAPARVADILDQVAAVLDHLHAHDVLHRDLKPANVMISPGGRVKVMDLGIARDLAGTRITRTHASPGTPFFFAPEQVSALSVRATDTYAAALIAYHLLTGRHHHPFDPRRADLREYLARLTGSPPDPWNPARRGGPLDRFFQRAFAARPEDRFPSAGAAARAFRAAGEAEDAPGTGAPATFRGSPFAPGSTPGFRSDVHPILSTGAARGRRVPRRASRGTRLAPLVVLVAAFLVAAFLRGPARPGPAPEGADPELAVADLGPPVLRYDGRGELLVELPPPPRGRADVRCGSSPATPESAPGSTLRFRCPAPGALEVDLVVGAVRRGWARLDPPPSPDQIRAGLRRRVLERGPAVWFSSAGEDEAATRLAATLEDTEVATWVRLGRDLLVADVDGDPRGDGAALASTLLLLDASLVLRGIPSPLAGLRERARPDLVRWSGYGEGLGPAPGRRVFPRDRNRFAVEGEAGNSAAMAWIWSERLPRLELPDPAEGRPGPRWLEVFTYGWEGIYHAEARVNGAGPFYLFDDPARGIATAGAGRDDAAQFRVLGARIPRAVLEPTNRVEVVFRTWPFTREHSLAYVIVEAVQLVDGARMATALAR